MRKIRIMSALPTGLRLWAEDARGGNKESIPVGGQAVIEGVLMKGPRQWGLAVRRPDGEIFQESWKVFTRAGDYPWKLPLLRGCVTMVEMMKTGFRALSRSAEVAMANDEEKLTTRDLCLAFGFGILLVVGLFIALPLHLSEKAAEMLKLSPFGRNAVEGALRAVIFIAYVAAIGLWKETRRVFHYHGAEHKTINAYEKNLEMTPSSVALQSRIHPRCGTSFLLVVILVGAVVFSCIGGGGVAWRIGSRLLLLPLLIGISYEIIRLAAKSELAVGLLMRPLLSLQYLTTREPDLKQIEVALVSLDTALKQGAKQSERVENI